MKKTQSPSPSAIRRKTLSIQELDPRTPTLPFSSSQQQHQQQQHQQEQAEQGLLYTLESRRSPVVHDGALVWTNSTDGERPPLHNVPPKAARHLLESAVKSSSASSVNSGSRGSSSRPLRDIARQVLERTKSTRHLRIPSQESNGSHNRTVSRAHAFLEMIQEDNTGNAGTNGANNNAADGNNSKDGATVSGESTGLFEGTTGMEPGESLFSLEGTDTDRLFAGASVVSNLLGDGPPAPPPEQVPSTTIVEEAPHEVSLESEHVATVIAFSPREHHDNNNEEALPFLSPSHNNNTLNPQERQPDTYGTSSLTSQPPHKRIHRRKKKLLARERLLKKIAQFFNPLRVLRQLYIMVCSAYFAIASVPIFAISWILYYLLGDPLFDFLPAHVSLAWWLNLAGRLLLTLELARLMQWMVIDTLIFGTRVAAKMVGPFVTLLMIQSRGWPFCLAMWGLLNMFLLHGSRSFQQQWFAFKTVGFVTPNTGTYSILVSPQYLRILSAMLLAGLVTALKRTTVAMYFGRRTFFEFKPRLEKLLKEVVLLSEVSELGLAIERTYAHEQQEEVELDFKKGRKVKFIGDVSFQNEDKKNANNASSRKIAVLDDSDDDEDDEQDSDASDDDEKKDELSDDADEADGFGPADSDVRSSTNSSTFPLRDMLGYWEEPVNAMDRTINASISDILNFRQALTFMDDSYPFGEAFGSASTREEVLASAANVYKRLIISSDQSVLSCDILNLLAEDEDGVTVDRAKKRAIRKLFRPDARHEIAMLTFIQACDALYKKIRYFRASVGNASVIDHALESIVDGVYYFLLTLVTLSVLRFNPWPLLVSISTLLVSVSFAVGPSAAKYIEGVLLIAVRRPYDLGDRIVMQDPSTPEADGKLSHSWLVEDISLFTTTIRYPASNEVATLSNASIASLRIVNGNRSPNAMVWFTIPFKISILESNNLDSYRSFLDNYAKLNPSTWHSLSYCRPDKVDFENEKVVVIAGIQSRFSWQSLGSIDMARMTLISEIYQFAKSKDLAYEELPQREVHYKAGNLKDVEGGTHKYRYELHQPSNVVPCFSTDLTTASKPEEVDVDAATPRSRLNTVDRNFVSALQESHY